MQEEDTFSCPRLSFPDQGKKEEKYKTSLLSPIFLPLAIWEITRGKRKKGKLKHTFASSSACHLNYDTAFLIKEGKHERRRRGFFYLLESVGGRRVTTTGKEEREGGERKKKPQNSSEGP